MRFPQVVLSLGAAALLLGAVPGKAQGKQGPGKDPRFTGFKWRFLGPANMSGRITGLAVDPSRPSTIYAATASGGLFKSATGGTTWKPVFEKEGAICVGAVALAPSDPDVVWVGTGEANPRNSVGWGDGVYVSRDGGGSWKHVGLEKTFQIGAVAVHPKDPNTVFVAACGRLWGPNPERGLYRTRDGGKTWELVLFVDDRTGAVDVVIDPSNPKHILAATYERQRDEFDGNHPAKRWGPGSGIWASWDGGDTWRKVTAGLPTVKMGRIGFSLFHRDPRIVYALIETERVGWARGNRKTAPGAKSRPSRTGGARRGRRGSGYLGIQGMEPSADGKGLVFDVVEGGPAWKGGLRSDDTVTKVNGIPVKSRQDLMQVFYSLRGGGIMKVEILRAGKKKTLSIKLGFRGGRGFQGSLGGQRENVQDKQGPKGFETGGVFRSDDGGRTWRRVNSLNPRPYYFCRIQVDPNDPDRIYVLGVRYYVSEDGGKTFKPFRIMPHPDFHAIWIDPKDSDHYLLGCDGGLQVTWDRGKTFRFFENIPCGQFYHVDADEREPYFVYGGLQDNGSWGGPSRTRFSDGIRLEDWFGIGGGDGFVCRASRTRPGVVFSESQLGNIGWRNILTGEGGRVRRPRPPKGKRLRFNWDTPYLLSPHAQDMIWIGGNYVILSTDMGARSRIVSPEISRTDRGSATALAESPLKQGLLYVGTDDGALWMTPDGGKTWKDIGKAVPGLPGPRFVSGLEASRFAEGRVYLSYDGHRSDDLGVYLYVSGDYGKSWRRIGKGIDKGPIHEVREDPFNPDLLYVGTEFGIFASLDRGEHFFSIKGNLPTVPVRDMVVQEKERELVAATHGRSLWVLDVSGLEACTAKAVKEEAALFRPVRGVQWFRYTRRTYGAGWFIAPNPPPGVNIHYWLKGDVKDDVSIFITDPTGNTIRYLKGSKKAGLHTVFWNFRKEAAQVSRRTRRGPRGSTAGPGTYGVRLKIGKKSFSTTLQVVSDPLADGGRR